jgi:outer membrane receptor protein involved in Fe transport
MNRFKKISQVALSLVATALASAQESDSQEDVFELTPFVVTENSEVGYLATETLSGTRIRSKLGDVGSSLDAITEEVLKDIGASDIYDAIDLAGNVNTWDKSGDQSEVQNQIWFANPYNSRGFLSTSVLVDFFEMGKQPIDFFSVTRLTVAKGPNAVLYGIGSPGGVLSLERKAALFGRNPVHLQTKVDSEGTFRATMDINREIIDGKLSLRVGAVRYDKEEFIEPAGWLRNGIYGAATWRPTRKTNINLFYQQGDEERIFRYGGVSYDSITPWITAGKPTHAMVGNSFSSAPGSGLDRDGRLTVNILNQPEVPATSWVGMASSERSEISEFFNLGLINLRNESWQKAYTEQNAIYDFENIQLIGDGLKRMLDWKDLMARVQQQLVPNLNLELAYNYNWSDYRTVQAFPGFQLMVDPNEVLPNNEPNPNFLNTYIETSRTEFVAEENTANTYRATLTYELNLRDKGFSNKLLLNRVNFVGMLERREVKSLFAGFRRVNTAPSLPGFPASNLRAWANKLSTRAYVQTDLTPAGANVVPYYKSDFTLIDDPDVTSGWIRHTSPRDIEEIRETYLFATQLFAWESANGFDRLILTAGIRDDKSSSQRVNFPIVSGNIYAGENFRGSPWEVADSVVFDGTLNYGTPDSKEITDEDPTQTYSAVFKLTRNWMLFYNFSDVLISSSALFKDIYGNAPPPTLGETHDFGIRAELLDSRLNASVTIFETSAVNQRESNIRGSMTNWINDMWDAIDPTSIIEEERWVTLRDDRSEGLEFSLVGNPLPNWSLRLNVSRIETTIDSRLPKTDQYIAEFLPLWEANASLPLVGDTNQGYETVGDAIGNLQRYVADIHATEGVAPRSQREWKVVLNTVYNFRSGPLDGFSFGGGFRWLDKDKIGYGINEDYLLDPTQPFYGDEIFVMDGMIRYVFNINQKRLSLQLNIDNLLDDRGTFARRAIDDLSGNPYYTRQQVKAPRIYSLTATLSW